MEQKSINEKSCELILQSAKDLYNEEIDRFKSTEVKAGILLTALGVVLNFYLSYLKDIKIELLSKYTVFYGFFLVTSIIILICAIISLIYLFASLKGSKYKQPDINTIVDDNLAEREPDDVALAIAATYQNVVNENRGNLKNKLKHYNRGLRLLLITVVLMTLYILIEGGIKVVIQ